MLTARANDLFTRLSPEVSKPETPVTSAVKVTARLEATQEGVCPYCKMLMRQTKAADVDVWVCDGDRHVAPLKS